MYEMLDLFMQWLVAPIVVVVWVLFNKATKNERDIAVIKAQHESRALHHDREMKEMKETIKAIFVKLDSIEQTLRNK
jgi:hypothetical protein